MSIHEILVTGGAGYIGSHLVDALVARDYRVTVLDNLEPQVHRSGTWPSLRQPEGTLCQRRRPRSRRCSSRSCSPSQAVVHFGAAVSVGQSMYQVDRYVDVNTRGTALLLDILVNSQAQRREGARRLVHRRLRRRGLPLRDARRRRADDPPGAPAGGARLGAALPALRRARPSIPTPEDKALYRDNIYSMTKYHQEEMVLLIGKTYGIPSVAPRFFNVYGPRQSLSNPVRGRRGDLAEPAAERQAAGRVRGRRPASRLRVDPRRGRLPGADAREHPAPTTCRSTSAPARPSRFWTSRRCSAGSSAARSSRR